MKKPHVMIADDDQHFRNALRIFLEAHGYRVTECWDGIGVLAKFRADNVDLLVLDHEMPAGAGRSIAEQLREEFLTPIIFVSGHERECFRELVTTSPELYYLPKPLVFEKLLFLLNQLFPCLERRNAAPTGSRRE